MTDWTEKAESLVGKRVRVYGSSWGGANINARTGKVVRIDPNDPGYVCVKPGQDKMEYVVHARQCVLLKPPKPREEAYPQPKKKEGEEMSLRKSFCKCTVWYRRLFWRRWTSMDMCLDSADRVLLIGLYCFRCYCVVIEREIWGKK